MYYCSIFFKKDDNGTLALNFFFLTANISGLKITLSFAINGTDSNALDLPGPKNGK